MAITALFPHQPWSVHQVCPAFLPHSYVAMPGSRFGSSGTVSCSARAEGQMRAQAGQDVQVQGSDMEAAGAWCTWCRISVSVTKLTRLRACADRIVKLQARGDEPKAAAARPPRRTESLFSRALADAAVGARGEAQSLQTLDEASLQGGERAPARHGGERRERHKHSSRHRHRE